MERYFWKIFFKEQSVMDNHPPVDNRLLYIPPIGWFLGACMIAALIAIFIFNISVKMTVNYSLLILIFGIKLFIQAGYGSRYQAHTASLLHWIT